MSETRRKGEEVMKIPTVASEETLTAPRRTLRTEDWRSTSAMVAVLAGVFAFHFFG